MIKLEEIIEQLCSAEFSQNYFTDAVTKQFMPERINEVINYVNTAVNDIHVNFLTYRGECVMQIKKGRVDYNFNVNSSLSDNPDKGFVLDTPEDPFSDNVLEITNVMTLERRPLSLNQERIVQHQRVGLNDEFKLENFQGSFVTPTWGTLRVHPKLEDCKIIVCYKVGGEVIKRVPQKEIDDGTYSIDDIIINLPYMFLMPIVYYATSRYSNSRGTERVGQGVFNEGNNFLSKYREECEAIVKNMNNNVVQEEPITVFEMNGFV